MGLGLSVYIKKSGSDKLMVGSDGLAFQFVAYVAYIVSHHIHKTKTNNTYIGTMFLVLLSQSQDLQLQKVALRNSAEEG